MITRQLHRSIVHSCYQVGCGSQAKKHNKLYWFDGDIIHSAEFCRNCYYVRTTERPIWMQNWDDHFVQQKGYHKTLTGCVAALVERSLS